MKMGEKGYGMKGGKMKSEHMKGGGKENKLSHWGKMITSNGKSPDIDPRSVSGCMGCRDKR